MIQKKISASPAFLSGADIESLSRMQDGEMKTRGGLGPPEAQLCHCHQNGCAY